jgi:hypothetical protein
MLVLFEIEILMLVVIWPQNHRDSFLVWALKLRSTVW